MKTLRSFLTLLVAGTLLLAISSPVRAELKSPQSVKGALRILNQVVGHTGRLIASKDYERVGGEHGEFTEGAAMLREAIANEPADFKAKVETALTDAVNASAALGPLGATREGEKLETAHAAFATKVKAVLELFPEDLRPKPRAPQK
jgi:hypothetical protein